MKRGIVYGITTAITFYMALLFESRSLLMIGILEVFIIIFALLYYLRLACRLRIEADAESMVNAIQDGYTIRFTVQNKSRLPINKMRIKVIEENVYAHQKQKAMVTLPVTAGIMKKDGQKEIIQVQTKWYPKDAGLYHIEVKRVFVSDWFGLLEFPLFRKHAKDVVEVLILPKKQPIVFEFNEESQTEAQQADSLYQLSEDGDGDWEYRSYQNGDKMHHIHWKLSAKAEEWMVRCQKAERKTELPFIIEMLPKEKKQKRESKKQQKKNREALFTLLYSSMLGLLEAGYRHKVIWYDHQKEQLCEFAVDTPSKAMLLLSSLEGLWSKKKMVSAKEQLELESRQPVGENRLILSSDLTLTNSQGMAVTFDANKLIVSKKKRRQKKAEQETERTKEQILYL